MEREIIKVTKDELLDIIDSEDSENHPDFLIVNTKEEIEDREKNITELTYILKRKIDKKYFSFSITQKWDGQMEIYDEDYKLTEVFKKTIKQIIYE